MNGHIQATCDGKCSEPYGCTLCNLFYCTVCRGAEGSLPSECPGKPISEENQQLIYQGTLDFRDGSWINRPLKKWEKFDPAKDQQSEMAAVLLNLQPQTTR